MHDLEDLHATASQVHRFCDYASDDPRGDVAFAQGSGAAPRGESALRPHRRRCGQRHRSPWPRQPIDAS
eukprot:4917490-Lingulodinium_polyedra.AAC.1